MTERLESTEKDSWTLALTIYGEARGEGFLGQVAVGWVARTRAEGRGLTIEEACRQKWQFSCWNGEGEKKLMAIPSYSIAYRRALGVAELVISGDLANPFPGATHYHTKEVHPYWADAPSMKKLGELGQHIFYREG